MNDEIRPDSGGRSTRPTAEFLRLAAETYPRIRRGEIRCRCGRPASIVIGEDDAAELVCRDCAESLDLDQRVRQQREAREALRRR
jgi:hypothetical protein